MSNTDKVRKEITCRSCVEFNKCDHILKTSVMRCFYQNEIAKEILSIKELHVEAEEQTPIPFNEDGKTGETFIRCEPKEGK